MSEQGVLGQLRPLLHEVLALAQDAPVNGRELRSMGAMQVRFFATIRECTGVSEIRWDEPVATLGELLHKLSERYGPTFRRWVLEKDEMGKTIIVVINGHDSRHQGGINASLHPDDMVAIFPAIAGGHGRT